MLLVDVGKILNLQVNIVDEDGNTHQVVEVNDILKYLTYEAEETHYRKET